jgi:predicted house-cleaning noncanonical NTP pyrophosphatase (MazG superfamily)
LEVLYALAEQQNITRDKLEEIRLAKQASRWAFKRKIILERTVESVKDTIL